MDTLLNILKTLVKQMRDMYLANMQLAYMEPLRGTYTLITPALSNKPSDRFDA